MEFILEVSFLPQSAFVSKAGFFEYTVRRAVAGKCPCLDAVEPEALVTAGDDRRDSFAHQALAPLIRMQLVADLASGLGTIDAANLVHAWMTLSPTTTALSASRNRVVDVSELFEHEADGRGPAPIDSSAGLAASQ